MDRASPLRRYSWLRASALLVVTFLALGAMAVLYLFDPARAPFYPRCTLYTVTGLHCPGCGSLRGLHQLVHGHLGAAFRYNPLLILSLPVAGYVAAAQELRRRGWAELPRPFRSTWSIWALLAVVLAFTVARNLPWAPFSWLAPTPGG